MAAADLLPWFSYIRSTLLVETSMCENALSAV